MKKSTLFFKVMVLLALLVPWTGWGQELTDPDLPSGANNSDIIADRSMVLTEDGYIPADNSLKGKNFSLSEFTARGDYNLEEWSFTGTMHPKETGLSQVDIKGQVQIKDKDAKPTVSAIYFEVKNNSTDETKWVVYGFAPAGTTVINKLTVSNSGKGSRPYNGKALTEDEVKNGLTVTATIGDKTETITDYTITTTLTDCVDADTYTIGIEVNGEYAGQTTGSVNFTITKRPITVTIADNKKLEFELGTDNPTFTASEYLVAKGEEHNENSGLVSKDGKEETPNFTGNLTINASEITDAGDKTVSVTYEETNIQDNTDTGFKRDNYEITLSLDNVSVTVKPIEIDADDVKGYDDETSKTVIIGGTEDYAVTYDGKEHKIGYVTVTVDGKEIALKNDEYIF